MIEGKFLVLITMWAGVGLVGLKDGWAAATIGLFAAIVTGGVLVS